MREREGGRERENCQSVLFTNKMRLREKGERDREGGEGRKKEKERERERKREREDKERERERLVLDVFRRIDTTAFAQTKQRVKNKIIRRKNHMKRMSSKE